MNTEIIRYIMRKINSEFEKCRWDDGVGRKFKENNLTAMKKSLTLLEDKFDEMNRVFREAENILSSTKEH